jgi:hypothetical protein
MRYARRSQVRSPSLLLSSSSPTSLACTHRAHELLCRFPSQRALSRAFVGRAASVRSKRDRCSRIARQLPVRSQRDRRSRASRVGVGCAFAVSKRSDLSHAFALHQRMRAESTC